MFALHIFFKINFIYTERVVYKKNTHNQKERQLGKGGFVIFSFLEKCRYDAMWPRRPAINKSAHDFQTGGGTLQFSKRRILPYYPGRGSDAERAPRRCHVVSYARVPSPVGPGPAGLRPHLVARTRAQPDVL